MSSTEPVEDARRAEADLLDAAASHIPVTITREQSQAEMLEQVMRTTVDDVDVIPFLTAEPNTRAALAALGRLLSNSHMRLVPGCPVVAWATGTALDPDWRRGYPVAAGSLWSNLTFLESLYGDPSTRGSCANWYEKLEVLRALESAEGF